MTYLGNYYVPFWNILPPDTALLTQKYFLAAAVNLSIL